MFLNKGVAFHKLDKHMKFKKKKHSNFRNITSLLLTPHFLLGDRQKLFSATIKELKKAVWYNKGFSQNKFTSTEHLNSKF